MSADAPAELTAKKKAAFVAVFLLLAFVCTAGLGELVMRIVVAHKLIYNIEMVKYAKELKTIDPEGVVSHVHRTNRSAKLMGVEIALNSLGHRSPELAAVKPALT